MAKKNQVTETRVLIVVGNEEFLCRRFIQEVIDTKSPEGWDVRHVDAGQEGALSDVLETSDGIFVGSQKTLVIVTNPHKVDVGVYESHLEDKDSQTVLLLHYDGLPKGNTKFGKFVAAHPKLVKEMKAPKPWEAEEAAVSFCIREAAKVHKIQMESAAAQLLAEYGGLNLGILSYEILKMATLAKAEGVSTITRQFAMRTLAMVAQVQLQPTVRALSERNSKKLVRALQRFQKSMKGDATILVCRTLGKEAQTWLAATSLREKGKSPEEIAGMLGLHPYVVKTKLLPQISLWTRSDLIQVLRALAQSERAVVTGAVSPWIGLVGRLISACKGS